MTGPALDPIAEGERSRRMNQRYETNNAEGAIEVARVSVKRLRTHLRPGLADSVASMLESDLESASQRVAWIRERLERDAAA